MAKLSEPITEKYGDDEACRQRILAAANNLITELGFDKTTMAEIAERSEFTLKYMSHHQGTLQAYMQHQTDVAPWIQKRIGQQRNQDIELLEQACDPGDNQAEVTDDGVVGYVATAITCLLQAG